jgi:hypothetical protein
MKNSDSGLTSGMWLIAVLILCLCGMFSMEYKTGMYKILNATVHGHSATVKLKLLFSILLTGIAFISASLPELIYTGRFFGYEGISLPLASIPDFPNVSFPIWSYIVLMLFLRFVVFTGIVMIIHAISLKVKNNAYSALISTGILLLPLFLYLFGFNLLNAVSLLSLITVNGIIVSPSFGKAVQTVVFITVSVMCVNYIIRKFGKA